MKCIVAVDNSFGIGRGADLLFHIPADLKKFKEITTGKVIIMGKNTLLSLPNQQPLPDRINIVLSTTLHRDDCVICPSLTALWKVLEPYNSDDVIVIGGEEVYKQLLCHCTTAYVTKVCAQANATSFFPDIDLMDNWRMINKSPKQIYNNLEYYFCEYKNNAVSAKQRG